METNRLRAFVATKRIINLEAITRLRPEPGQYIDITTNDTKQVQREENGEKEKEINISDEKIERNGEQRTTPFAGTKETDDKTEWQTLSD